MIDKQKMYKNKRKKAKKMLESYKGKETSIEKKVRIYLESLGIFFQTQYGMEYIHKKIRLYRVYDFYISGVNEKGSNYAFLIETDGDYFHCTDYLEGNVKRDALTYTQKRNLKNDKIKNMIAHKKGIPLLRLKEKDIKWDFEKVKNEIYNMINSF